MNYNEMNLNDLLMHWQALDQNLKIIKTNEMELRKLIVEKAFPDVKEGSNTKKLGNGYELKANIKLNYKLDKDVEKIDYALKLIENIGNEGSFIAEELVKWKPELVLSEYRKLQENGSEIRKKIKILIDSVLTISDSAPTLTICEPKK